MNLLFHMRVELSNYLRKHQLMESWHNMWTVSVLALLALSITCDGEDSNRAKRAAIDICTHPGRICLRGGGGDHEGNVFIGVGSGHSKPVCDDSWDINDGRVVCRELGYHGVLKVTKQSYYGQVSSDFGAYNVNCDGTETGLAECSYSSWWDDCDGGEGAGVVCDTRTMKEIECTHPGRICLRGGGGDHEGNVFIGVGNSISKPVCHDDWDSVDGGVVCRELGFNSIVKVTRQSRYGWVSPNFGANNVNCDGTETGLAECSYSSQDNCDGGDGAGVVCSMTMDNCTHPGRICLRGGRGVHEGNVFIGIGNGISKPVCDDDWDFRDGMVVCRELGYHGIVRVSSQSSYGQVSSHFGADNVNCEGTESGLAECSFSSQDDCSGSEGAGVVCDTRSRREMGVEEVYDPCFEPGVSYQFGEFIDIDVRESSSECQRHCRNHVDCNYFTFYPSTRECYRKRVSSFTKTAVYGAVSGPRNCGEFPSLHPDVPVDLTVIAGDSDKTFSLFGVHFRVKYTDPEDIFKGGKLLLSVDDLRKLLCNARVGKIEVLFNFDAGDTVGLFDLDIYYHLEHADDHGVEAGTLKMFRRKEGNNWVSHLKTQNTSAPHVARSIIPSVINHAQIEVVSDRETEFILNHMFIKFNQMQLGLKVIKVIIGEIILGQTKFNLKHMFNMFNPFNPKNAMALREVIRQTKLNLKHTFNMINTMQLTEVVRQTKVNLRYVNMYDSRVGKIDVLFNFDGGVSQTDGLFDLDIDYNLVHADNHGVEAGTLKMFRRKEGNNWVTHLKTQTSGAPHGVRSIIPSIINNAQIDVVSDRQTKFNLKYVNKYKSRDLEINVDRIPGRELHLTIGKTNGSKMIDLKFTASDLNLSDFDGNFRVDLEGTVFGEAISGWTVSTGTSQGYRVKVDLAKGGRKFLQVDSKVNADPAKMQFSTKTQYSVHAGVLQGTVIMKFANKEFTYSHVNTDSKEKLELRVFLNPGDKLEIEGKKNGNSMWKYSTKRTTIDNAQKYELTLTTNMTLNSQSTFYTLLEDHYPYGAFNVRRNEVRIFIDRQNKNFLLPKFLVDVKLYKEGERVVTLNIDSRSSPYTFLFIAPRVFRRWNINMDKIEGRMTHVPGSGIDMILFEGFRQEIIVNINSTTSLQTFLVTRPRLSSRPPLFIAEHGYNSMGGRNISMLEMMGSKQMMKIELSTEKIDTDDEIKLVLRDSVEIDRHSLLYRILNVRFFCISMFTPFFERKEEYEIYIHKKEKNMFLNKFYVKGEIKKDTQVIMKGLLTTNETPYKMSLYLPALLNEIDRNMDEYVVTVNHNPGRMLEVSTNDRRGFRGFKISRTGNGNERELEVNGKKVGKHDYNLTENSFRTKITGMDWKTNKIMLNIDVATEKIVNDNEIKLVLRDSVEIDRNSISWTLRRNTPLELYRVIFRSCRRLFSPFKTGKGEYEIYIDKNDTLGKPSKSNENYLF